MNQKSLPVRQTGLAPILIVILLAAALVGGYFVYTSYSNSQTKVNPTQLTTKPKPKPSPSPSNITHESTTSGETANWKIYTNNKYHFQVKYPSNWYEDGHEYYVYFYPPQANLKEALEHPEDMDLAMDLASAPSIYIQILNKSISNEPNGNRVEQGIDYISDWKSLKIDSLDGIYYKAHQCAPQCYSSTAFPLDNQHTIEINISSAAENQYYTPIYNQILSTFKFLP